MPSNKSKQSTIKSTGDSRVQADRYRMLIEAVADGIYEVDLSGNFRFFNDALCRRANSGL
ncbi:unnamed protein product, partial [marine sediment metagenome]